MSKELENKATMIQVITCLNALLDRANHDEYLSRIGKKEALKFLEENQKYADIIKSNLQRLEAIDNAKPSEALETLKDMLIGNGCNDSINDYVDNLILPIKQLLQRLEQIDNAVNICKKANEQKYVYIKETYGIIKEKFLDDLDYEILNNRLYVNSRGIYYDYPLKDYGNWWALTKEELENE